MAKPPHIVTIIGARPQFLKAAPLSAALRATARETVIHTGQHYDRQMSGVFFDELRMPKPSYHLRVGSGSHAVQTGAMMVALERVLLRLRPDCVLVFGDTNSTLAGALVAAKLSIPLAHVEAGMRSFDRAMPEEVNRVVTDHLASILFCPSPAAKQNLAREGITKHVYVDGDNMLDLLFASLPRARKTSAILRTERLAPRAYLLMTLHRAANTDASGNLRRIVRLLRALCDDVVFPLHPRTRVRLRACGLLRTLELLPHVRLLEPVGYLDMLMLLANARMVLTDSGGVQKEAFALKVPCLTLRTTTEWVETVSLGWNRLVGMEVAPIIRLVRSGLHPKPHRQIYGNGHASSAIARHLVRFLQH